MAERARHPHEFELDNTLKIDVQWYKKQQVHPLVSRLLGPVEGTDASRVAECLGMDGARFAMRQGAAGDEDMHNSFTESMSSDLNALFDRKLRWKEFQSMLEGISCLKCSEKIAWKQMLQPDSLEAD